MIVAAPTTAPAAPAPDPGPAAAAAAVAQKAEPADPKLGALLSFVEWDKIVEKETMVDEEAWCVHYRKQASGYWGLAKKDRYSHCSLQLGARMRSCVLHWACRFDKCHF